VRKQEDLFRKFIVKKKIPAESSSHHYSKSNERNKQQKEMFGKFLVRKKKPESNSHERLYHKNNERKKRSVEQQKEMFSKFLVRKKKPESNSHERHERHHHNYKAMMRIKNADKPHKEMFSKFIVRKEHRDQRHHRRAPVNLNSAAAQERAKKFSKLSKEQKGIKSQYQHKQQPSKRRRLHRDVSIQALFKRRNSISSLHSIHDDEIIVKAAKFYSKNVILCFLIPPVAVYLMERKYYGDGASNGFIVFLSTSICIIATLLGLGPLYSLTRLFLTQFWEV